MTFWWLLAACGEDPRLRAWHGSFALTSVASAQETDGDCDPALEDGGVDEPYAFVAVSPGATDVASLYLCDGPDAEDCPLQPVGNVRLRRWTETRLVGEAVVATVFGELCTMSWNGIDARRTDEGAVHLELRTANRQDAIPDLETCGQVAQDLVNSSCDAVLVLDGTQE